MSLKSYYVSKEREIALIMFFGGEKHVIVFLEGGFPRSRLHDKEITSQN